MFKAERQTVFLLARSEKVDRDGEKKFQRGWNKKISPHKLSLNFSGNNVMLRY